MHIAWAARLSIVALVSLAAAQYVNNLPVCSLAEDGITISEFTFDGYVSLETIPLGSDGKVASCIGDVGWLTLRCFLRTSW